MSRYLPSDREGPGRPKGSAWVRHLAAKYTEEAITALAEIARDMEQDGRTRLMAWNAILDRAHGKPAQTIGGEDGEPIKVEASGLLESLKRLADRNSGS